MAILKENRWVGRPAPGQGIPGPTLEHLIVRLRDNLKVNDETGCWEWQGARNPKTNYGVIRVGKKHLLYVHRTMLELVMGHPLTAGKCALHDCDNPPCGNQEHLFEGTKADNNRDKCDKRRCHHRGHSPCQS